MEEKHRGEGHSSPWPSQYTKVLGVFFFCLLAPLCFPVSPSTVVPPCPRQHGIKADGGERVEAARARRGWQGREGGGTCGHQESSWVSGVSVGV